MMAYIGLAAVKAELKIENDTDDGLLADYITLAQRLIEMPRPVGTGRVFEVASDTTRYLDAPSDQGNRTPDGPLYVLLMWPYGDICSITSVVNGDGTTLTTADYVTEPRVGTPYWALRLKRGGSNVIWAATDAPEAAIAITGKWAYSTSAPLDIGRAALRLVVWMYRGRDNDGFDADIRTDDGLTILGAKMPRDIRSIIETYWSLV